MRRMHLSTISPFDYELVLQHDKVALARRICHERLQARTERVEQVSSTRNKWLLREEPDPTEAGDNTHRLSSVRE